VPQWRAVFPDQPPPLVRAYSIEVPPAPPPPPPADPRPARPATAAVTDAPPDTPAVAPMPDLAPTIIPDTIPVVPLRSPTLSLAAMTAEIAPSAGVAGGGAEGGTGESSGKADKLQGGVLVGERVVFARNSNLPLFVERKRFPQYPEDDRMLNREADVTLRYVIGKDGHVNEVVVLEHPRWPRFEDAAISAVRTWRFRPFTVDGEAHEVVHELVVSFRIE
jgi:protein TonB